MLEQWKQVPGWEGWYEVSDFGCVRSVDRISIAGGHPATYRGKILKLAQSRNKYPFVALSRPGEKRYCYVHDLVLSDFVGPKPVGLEVRHRDGIRDRNRLSNICYGTRSQNAIDRIAHGNGPQPGQVVGEMIGTSVLTEPQVLQIRQMQGTLKEIAARFGVHFGTIHCIKTRKTWKHI